ADYYEALVKASGADPKTCANWQTGALSAALNAENLAIEQARVGPAVLGGLLQRIAVGTLSGKMAKEVFDALWSGEDASADRVIEKRGLRQISDAGAIEKLVDQVLIANA